mmetsp:Transcript_35115/g.71001  ORF Transcript_35115/g.71001 Transcript_35115/m.71001 type:complete len:234 (+) Transcript_35115:257-958(+)
MPNVILRKGIVISAPVDLVFDCVADPQQYARCQPSVVNLEFLATPERGDIRRGVGTRFRETRKCGKFHSTCELECTSYVKNEQLRMVRDANKRDVWDYLVTVEGRDDGASTFLVLEARAYSPLSKIATLLFGKCIRSELIGDMENVKRHCEREMKWRAEQHQQIQEGHVAWNRGDDVATLHVVPMGKLTTKNRDRSTGSSTYKSSTSTESVGQREARPAVTSTKKSSFTPAAA